MNDFLPFDTLLVNPFVTLGRAARIVLVSLLLGLVIPGFANYLLGTFSEEDIITKLPDEELKKNIQAFNDDTKELKKKLVQIDRRIAELVSIENSKEMSTVFEFRRITEQYIDKRKLPIHIVPFIQPTMLLWPVFYISFFWIIFLLAPEKQYIRGLSP